MNADTLQDSTGAIQPKFVALFGLKKASVLERICLPGDSFVSGAATPVFALAAATSEYFDNAWYAAILAHAGAVAVGFGRMGKDAHWLSDIAGSALLEIGTTELLLYLRNRNLAGWSRVRVAAVASNLGTPGIAISLNW